MPWFTVTTSRPRLPLSDIAFFLLSVAVILFAGVVVGVCWAVPV